MTQVAGTSARADGTIEMTVAAINAVSGKVCRERGFIVRTPPVGRRFTEAGDFAPTDLD
ncbi:hypothetical protein GCM10007857_30870 [Bradyrhizobium iriomotense]|uniref:Uncharacterized protein n=1 Tax=Bradyrhizobium iriomotense TaxID=441950 RepID=A0ABQ6B1D5_9BRAD|nr:hypothetical protein GCM10007857_30870 [Bradyrhizobium iriomotense]